MKPIGGFFELEVARGDGPFHGGALALTSGRACLRLALATVRPRRVFVPFYSCDAVLEPIRTLGAPIEFYAIDRALVPVLPGGVNPEDAVVVINYFGLKSAAVKTLATRFGASLIIDATQSFFDRGLPGSWLFNSARKFFGVPDGAYLYAPAPLTIDAPPPNRNVGWNHLTLRLMGNQEDAYRAFLDNEESITSEALGMSLGSERILGGIDYPAVIGRRRANFALYAAALGDRNDLPLPLGIGEAPFCYPFLPDQAIRVRRFHERGIFVPTLWKDCVDRDAPGFSWERDLANRLLPLPVDHRLGADEVGRVLEAVTQFLKG
jgi:hypothetical protein